MRMTTMRFYLPCVTPGSAARQPHRELPARHLPAHALEHRLHLSELLEEAVHVLNRGPAPLGDAAPPAAVDDLRPVALAARHRLDDGLGALQLLFIHVRARRKLHPGDHLHDLLERPQLLHLLELPEKVLEREALLPQLLLEILGLL